MTTEKPVNQPTLFEPAETVDPTRLALYALGDFQSRGKLLAARPLALDRLRGAFKRAAEKFQVEELADEKIAETLESLGARVVRRQSFVAKHPFTVTIGEDLAQKAADFYKETVSPESEV